MVKVRYARSFRVKFDRIKEPLLRKRVRNQIEKIIANPEVGKPMQHARKGTREVYVKPFRLSYAYVRAEERIVIVDLYHKKEQ